ncbi:MAG: VOC family protein [Actinobacteria bacterium]|nr:VOC family protein [Actinomycetota bacterium]
MATPPKIVQLAFCTSNMPRSVAFYSSVFGFADAGGRVFSGPWLARIQDVGDDAATTLWWLVGRQDMVQLELFAHTEPTQRPLPADWTAADLGWTRWGLTVPDFDAVLEKLARHGVPTLTEPVEHDGLRRVCFRDPYVGVVVEVLEEGSATPGGIRPRFYDLAPAVVYAAATVPDLEAARRSLVDVAGLFEEPAGTLHAPEHEALWGLGGARAERFVARGGDVYLEVTEYAEPRSRPADPDRRLSDQGFMNVALGGRERAEAEALLERMRAAGAHVHAELMPGKVGGTYLTDPNGIGLEILANTRDWDPSFGFTPVPQFLSSPGWPQASVPPASS